MRRGFLSPERRKKRETLQQSAVNRKRLLGRYRIRPAGISCQSKHSVRSRKYGCKTARHKPETRKIALRIDAHDFIGVFAREVEVTIGAKLEASQRVGR